MSQRGLLQMLQHQVSSLLFSKSFSGISYFLFVPCIQLLHVIVQNPSLQTFLSSLSFQSSLLTAKRRVLVQTSQSSTSKNHLMWSRLSACPALASPWCGEQTGRDSSWAEAISTNHCYLQGQCLQEVAAQLAASVLSWDIRLRVP